MNATSRLMAQPSQIMTAAPFHASSSVGSILHLLHPDWLTLPPASHTQYT